MRLRSIALAAALVAAAPATAGAATWSAPQDLSSAHLFVDQPRLLVTGNGGALASWAWTDGVGADGRTGASVAPRKAGAEAFAKSRSLVRSHRIGTGEGEAVADVAGFGRNGVLVASTRGVGAVAKQRFRLSIRRGTVDGTFEKRRGLRTAKGIRSVRLAANGSGDAAIAWFEDRGVRNDRVYVALRKAGHGFGEPRRLATGRIRSVAVALGASGDVLVAWDARGKVQARFKARTRSAFYATDTIRSKPAFFADLHPVVDNAGRAAIAWSAQFGSEGGDSGPVFFQVAIRRFGKKPFRRARLLEQLGSEQVPRTIDAAEGATGRLIVAWSGSDGATRRVKARQFSPGLVPGPVQEVSPAGTDAILSDLATDPFHLGEAIVVWDNGSFEANQVWAAVSPDADAPFGVAEAVSPAQEARDGHAAFDARTHQPTVVWTNRPAGSNVPLEQIRTFAQASVRVP
jgi:hypothetical protein